MCNQKLVSFNASIEKVMMEIDQGNNRNARLSMQMIGRQLNRANATTVPKLAEIRQALLSMLRDLPTRDIVSGRNYITFTEEFSSAVCVGSSTPIFLILSIS